VDPNNITGDEILSRLVNLNQDAFLKAATRGAFLQVETMLNGDRLKRLESVIGHLENDTSVESMLHDAFEMMVCNYFILCHNNL